MKKKVQKMLGNTYYQCEYKLAMLQYFFLLLSVNRTGSHHIYSTFQKIERNSSSTYSE